MISLFVVLAWQIVLAVAVLWSTPQFIELWTGLGAELPVYSRLFVATYLFWVLLPGPTVAILIRARRHQLTASAARWLLAADISGTLLLVGWAVASFYLPTMGWHTINTI